MLVVVVDEAFDWLAWLSPSCYTAAHRLGVVMMTLNSVFMRINVHGHYFENYVCARCYFGKRREGNIRLSKYPAMCKRSLKLEFSTSVYFGCMIYMEGHNN